MMDSQTLEIAFFVLSVLCIFANGYLFTLKLSELIEIKRQRVNGPVLFMKWDNIRHQCFMLAVAAGMTALAVSGLNNPEPIGAQSRNLLTGSIGFALLVLGDAAFTFRRRIKLAALVAKYEADALAAIGLPGGKRKHDPPKVQLMPDNLDPITITNAQDQVLSPSPVPGEELPKRRAEDTATYKTEWAVMVGALCVWAGSFFADMAAYEVWSEMLTPKFIGIHGGQLVGAIVAVVAAKRMKN